MPPIVSIINVNCYEPQFKLSHLCYHNLIFQNFKKPFEPSKYKTLDQNHYLKCWKSTETTQIIFFLCRWLWQIKTKKEGVLEGCLLFSFLPFCWFPHNCLFWVMTLVQIWSCFWCTFCGFEQFRILEILNYTQRYQTHGAKLWNRHVKIVVHYDTCLQDACEARNSNKYNFKYFKV